MQHRTRVHLISCSLFMAEHSLNSRTAMKKRSQPIAKTQEIQWNSVKFSVLQRYLIWCNVITFLTFECKTSNFNKKKIIIIISLYTWNVWLKTQREKIRFVYFCVHTVVWHYFELRCGSKAQEIGHFLHPLMSVSVSFAWLKPNIHAHTLTYWSGKMERNDRNAKMKRRTS